MRRQRPLSRVSLPHPGRACPQAASLAGFGAFKALLVLLLLLLSQLLLPALGLSVCTFQHFLWRRVGVDPEACLAGFSGGNFHG